MCTCVSENNSYTTAILRGISVRKTDATPSTLLAKIHIKMPMYCVKYVNTVVFADYCINSINGFISKVSLMHDCDCGRISGGQMPLVLALIKVTMQKYVKNKYKPRTNPCD